MTRTRTEPSRVLVVGWFPAVDNTSAGRFVADQVAALGATGAVRPSVVSFENAAVRGPGGIRDRQAEAIVAVGRAGVLRSSPFNVRGVAGPDGVSVARLTIPGGQTPASGPDHRAVHRTTALRSLLDRPEARAWDLVHAHVGYPEGVAGVAAAADLGVPVVITEHASFLATLFAEPIVKARYLEAARAASRVIAVSRMLAGELLAAFPELDGRIVVIPNTVAVDDFAAGPPAGNRVAGELLWVGGRSEAKGTATLLRAFARIHRVRPETSLRLIGQSSQPSGDTRWRQLAADLGVTAAVRFERSLDRAGVIAAMQRADLFIHPSPRETFGVVAVEALAAGLPVVAVDSGGVTEVMGDEPDLFGAVAPGADPEALAAAVVRTLDRRSAFDPVRLRTHVAERYAAATVARRIVDLYDEVLAEHAAGRRLSSSGGGLKPGPVRGAAVDDQPLPIRTLIVGFSRLELDRAIARVPGWVCDAATIVSTGPPSHQVELVLAPIGTEARLAQLLGWGAPVSGRPDRVVRRLRQTMTTVMARLARRPARADPAERLLDVLAATLAACLPASPGPDAPLVVCVGGIDHLIVAPFIAAGRAVAAPGGLRWLADARLATARASDAGSAGSAGSEGQAAPAGSRDA